MNLCNDGDVLSIIKIVLIIINILQVLIPLLIIITAIIEFSKAAIANKDDKLNESFKILIKKIIAGIIVYISPFIIEGVFGLLSNEISDYHACIENANPEGISNAYYNKAKYLTEKARLTLEVSDYNDAKSYLDNKEFDESKKEELLKELKETNEYINIQSNIEKVTTQKQYNLLEKQINNIKDSSVKEKLSKQLEERKDDIKKDEPVKISTTGSIIRKEETNTLKVYIYQENTYYITQIWANKPYTQLNKYDSPEYGQNLYRPGALLEKAIQDNNLQKKLIVGFNASGFYLKDTYDAASVNYYPAYNKTSVGTLVITNGKVIRNAYDKSYKTWFITGVNKNNKLKIYTDEKTDDIVAKQKWSKDVINSIRNTFTFASPLIMNGQPINITTSFPSPSSALNRQAICQIDDNNFLLITGSNLTRQNLIDIMINNNCQTGTNFDGGGSIALLFKSSTSNEIETIIGNGRSLTEVGYFTE